MVAGARRWSGRQRGWPESQRHSSLLVSARQLQALVRHQRSPSSVRGAAQGTKVGSRVGYDALGTARVPGTLEQPSVFVELTPCTIEVLTRFLLCAVYGSKSLKTKPEAAAGVVVVPHL